MICASCPSACRCLPDDRKISVRTNRTKQPSSRISIKKLVINQRSQEKFSLDGINSREAHSQVSHMTWLTGDLSDLAQDGSDGPGNLRRMVSLDSGRKQHSRPLPLTQPQQIRCRTQGEIGEVHHVFASSLAQRLAHDALPELR